MKSSSPTFHFDEEKTTTPTMLNTQELEKSKIPITKRHSVNNLTVDNSNHFKSGNDDNNLKDNKSTTTLTPVSRRHSSFEPSNNRRLGNSRRRMGSSSSSHIKHNDHNELGLSEESDDYDFMNEVRKQRSRSFNSQSVCYLFYC